MIEDGIGRHKGIVHPMSIDISSNRIVAYQEPGFCLDVDEKRRKKLREAARLVFPIEEATEMLEKYAEELKKYNENNKLSFYDNNGKRYINSIYEYYSKYTNYFKYFLDKIKEMYDYIHTHPFEQTWGICSVCYEFFKKSINISERDFGYIFIIFSTEDSNDILKENHYNFFKPSRKYQNEQENAYCEAVTAVLTEIMIKTYNFDLYYKKDENSLLEEIAENYSDHVEEANSKKSFRKIFKRH